MKLKITKYENVNDDGTFEDKEGAISLDKGVKHGYGCGLPNCECSSYYWLSISSGLKVYDREVDVATYLFDSKEEYEEFMATTFKELSKTVS